jgi:acetylornithine aminotransferase
MRAALNEHTCAVMLEPVQGEGGVNLPPEGYLRDVRALCDEHDMLLIFDEVQVGCGRTGTLFAYQHDGVEPDIMTLAKALAGGPPIGAAIFREKYAEILGPGSHGSTFGGNPLISAAGVAALKTLLEDGVLENCRAMGDYLRKRLEELRQRYSFVTEVRGRGLILGMELSIEGAEIVKKCLAKGLLINCTVGKVLRFLPPLIVTKDEIDEAMGILDSVLQEYK